MKGNYKIPKSVDRQKICWKKPQEAMFKANFDGGQQKMGIGAVIRYSNEDVIASMCAS